MQLIGIVGVLLFLALSTCHAGCFNKPVSNIRAIESALDLYYIHCGRYPESLALMLKENVATGLNCLKSTLTRIPIDPWGNPFRVEINNSFPVVLSAGPDMRYGTEDDVRGIGIIFHFYCVAGDRWNFYCS